MGTYKNAPTGNIFGRIGNAVAYQLNGQNVVRSLPGKRSGKAGEREQANRMKFAQMQLWLKPLLSFLRIGFKNYAPTFQGFVAAKSYNSKHAFAQKEDGSWYIDPALALVSFGSLALPKTMTMEQNDRELTITWSTDNSNSMFDLAMVLAYHAEAGFVNYDTAAAKRHAGKAIFPLSVNEEAHIYLAFISEDHSSQSNSYYLGTAKRS